MTRARELGKLANRNTLTADNTNNFVGIGSTQPDARLDVDGTVLVGTAITLGGASGIVSATSFYGDGSNLDGVASAGLGTALAEEGAGSVIYYTDSVLGIGSTVVVDPPSSTRVAYTQYTDVSLDENVDLIVAEGDDFVPDVLGISTAGITTMTGVGGRIRAGTFTNKAGTGAPQLTFGAEIPVGYGLTGAGGINVGGAATIGGNLNVGGVLTYEDVTNIDSLGIITARSNVSIADSIIHTGDTDTSIRFPSAGTFTVSTNGSERLRVDSSGHVFTSNFDTSSASGGGSKLWQTGGFHVQLASSASSSYLIRGFSGTTETFNVYNDGSALFKGNITVPDKIIHDGDTNTSIRFPADDTVTVETAGTERVRIHPSGISHFKSGLAEKVNVKTQLAGANSCAITDGNVILTTSAESGNTYPDITGVHSVLSSGEGFSVTIALKVDGSGTINGFRIDGVAQTIEWSGGSAPSAGSDGYDVFTFSAFKTGSGTTDYKVFGAATNYT